MSTDFQLNRAVALCASLGIPLMCILLLTDKALLYAVIFFGQAHFLITYIYTNKAKKIDAHYTIKFFGLVATLGLICFFVVKHREYLPWFIVFTSVVFVLHYLSDEFKISNTKEIRYRWLALTSLTLSYSSAFISKLFSAEQSVLYTLCILSILLFLFFSYHTLRQKKTNVIPIFLFLLGNVIVSNALAFTEQVSVQQLLGFIILFHYIRWYIYYFQRFSGESLVFYLDIVLWSHIFVTLTFFQFILAPLTGILFIFFTPTFFYGWTTIHILLSMRKSDYSLR